jgi:hypothetical protein
MDNSKVPIDSNNPQNPNSANIKKKQQPNAVPAPNGHAGGIIIGNPHKINVDDNFRVLNLSGRDLRFQWSIVVMNYCNKDVQQASEIYKKLFVNYDEFMYPTNCGTNKLYREAFDHEFGIFITDKKAEIHHPQPNTEGFLVPRNKYLSDYESQILQAIDTHRCVQIVAPTGTGKTVLINRIASKRLCIIVIPFNSQISLYKKIPQPYNPQIFYPFILGQPATPQQMKAQKIATSDFNYVCVKQKEKIPSSQVVKNKEHPVRKPFSKLERNMDFKDVPSEIEIEKIVDPNYLRFDPDNTNVCVWDRFVQKISYLNEDFRNHIIIIDESHLLFTDRSYRKAAVKFVKLIRKFKGKVVLVTATPTWEHKLLKIDHTLKFFRDRNPVRLNWIDSCNPYNTIERLVDILRRSQSKIVVFSDTSARKLYENCVAKGKYNSDEITMVHSKFWDQSGNNATEVLDNEMLDRSLTICTRIAYAGINFKNKKEKIIVIIEVNSNTDAAYIIQALGRIRKADVEAYVVFDKRVHVNASAEERKMAAKELGKHTRNPVVNNFLTENEKYTNWYVEKQLEDYYSSEANKGVIIERLCRSGYIEVFDYGGDRYARRRKMPNEYKRQESDRFIEEYIVKESHKTVDFTLPAASYWIEWWLQYGRILSDLDPKDVKLYTNLRKEGSSIEVDTILTELEDLVKLCKMSKLVRERLQDDYKKYAKNATRRWKCPLAIRIFTKKCKELHEILSKVIVIKGITKEDDGNNTEDGLSIEDVFDAKIDIIERNKAIIKVIRSDNGKKGDKAKKSMGGKKGNRMGKSEGGRKGGQKSSRKMSVTLEWIGDNDLRPDGLDNQGRITFESKTLCCEYLRVGSECFYKFCNTNDGAKKLRKFWKIIKTEE